MDHRQGDDGLRPADETSRKPIALHPDYLLFVDRLEQHPDNQDGSDKTWVERVMKAYREHYRQARLVE